MQSLQQALKQDLRSKLQLEGLLAQADHHRRMPSRLRHLAEKMKALQSGFSHQFSQVWVLQTRLPKLQVCYAVIESKIAMQF